MGGTAYESIQLALESTSRYTASRAGKVSAIDYQEWVTQHLPEFNDQLNEDRLNLSARFPRDKHDFVARALSHCRSVDIILDDTYDRQRTEQFLAWFDKQFDHGNYMTYIFPEESAFIHALTRNERPNNAVFMGSYYGYWAAAAKAAHPSMSVTLCDINETSMNLARRNFENLGIQNNVNFALGDAEETVASLKDVDLVVLDAEGPMSEDIHEDYRDKAIYYPHLRAVMDALAPGALLVAHNVILSNFTNGPYFETRQEYYRGQYAKFLPLVKKNFVYTILDSTEGILIARKR